MSKGRPVQYFSDEAIERGRQLSPEQILAFLEDFRTLHASTRSGKSILISLKVPEDLLRLFKLKAKLKGVRYQTWIKDLMKREVT